MTNQDPSSGTPQSPPRAAGPLHRLTGLPRAAWRRLFARTPAPGEEELDLPPMSRGLQAFSMLIFFLLGAGLTALLVANPLGISFLPSTADTAPAAGGPSLPQPETLYQCPMHPEVIESEPGACPKCGMRLVALESADHGASAEAAHPARTADAEREILYWYAPMDPTYVRDAPGLSPMGMKLVPKYADQVASEGGVITIDPVQVQNIGVVSVPAKTEDIARRSRTVGILDFNADRITWINTKFEGWIEKAYVNYVGQEVKKGQPLFAIYSPELVTTQEEYLRALSYRQSLQDSGRPETLRQADSLVQSTRDRLLYWDISAAQIGHLEATREVQRRLTVTSPVDAVVASVMDEALEGMYVRPGMDLYKLANLSTIWVHADIYESDLPWIRKDLPVVITFRQDTQRKFRGKILFLYPEVNRETRTLKICVEVPNADRKLRAGMYADVIVEGPPVRDAVVVPQSAVIRSGERNIVFVDLGNGRFEPREVTLGVRGESDRVQIQSGVSPGENVVTQSQFMLDSESRIQEAIAKFLERGTAPAQAPGHAADHDHGARP